MLSGKSCKGNGYSYHNIKGRVNWNSLALIIVFFLLSVYRDGREFLSEISWILFPSIYMKLKGIDEYLTKKGIF